ncbi:MAG: DUF4890 domain-containing protein [Bacteroidota bacterium]
MKSPIKFVVIIALFFAFTFSANAQRGDRPPRDPAQMAERQTTQMVEKLGLDEIQTVKVKEINLAYAKKMQEAHEDNEGNREALREIRTAINTEKSAELKLILTEEQFSAYEEMQAKRGKGKRKGGKRERRSRR